MALSVPAQKRDPALNRCIVLCCPDFPTLCCHKIDSSVGSRCKVTGNLELGPGNLVVESAQLLLNRGCIYGMRVKADTPISSKQVAAELENGGEPNSKFLIPNIAGTPR